MTSVNCSLSLFGIKDWNILWLFNRLVTNCYCENDFFFWPITGYCENYCFPCFSSYLFGKVRKLFLWFLTDVWYSVLSFKIVSTRDAFRNSVCLFFNFKNDFGNIVVVLYSKSLYLKVSLQKWLGRCNIFYKPFFDVGLCIEASARCFAFAWQTRYRIVGGGFFANEM